MNFLSKCLVFIAGQDILDSYCFVIIYVKVVCFLIVNQFNLNFFLEVIFLCNPYCDFEHNIVNKYLEVHDKIKSLYHYVNNALDKKYSSSLFIYLAVVTFLPN